MDRRRRCCLCTALGIAFGSAALEIAAETANVSMALEAVLDEADARRILETHMGSLKTLDSGVLHIVVQRNWWNIAREIVAESHVQQVDVSVPVRQAVKRLKDESDELVRSLNPKYGTAQKVSPAFQWAQNDTCIFLTVKYSVRWNAPGTLELTQPTVNVSGNSFNLSGFGQHSNYKYHYSLSLMLFDAIVATSSSWSFPSIKGSVTLRKLWPRKWPRLLSKKGAKVGDMLMAHEMQDKLDHTLQKVKTAHNSPSTCALEQKLYCLPSDKCMKPSLCSECRGKPTPKPEAHLCVGVPTEAATFDFSDNDLDGRELGGSVQIHNAKTELDISSYVVYFGADNKTKLLLEDGSAHVIGEAMARTPSVVIPMNTPIPTSATHLLVFSKNEQGECEMPGSTEISDAVIPFEPPRGVSFSDEDGGRGVVGGKIRVENAENEENSMIEDYALYWGKSSTKKIAGSNKLIVGSIPKTGTHKGTYTIPKNTTIPEKARYILAYAKNSHGEHPSPVSAKIIDNTKPCISSEDVDCPSGVEVTTSKDDITFSIHQAKQEDILESYSLYWGRMPCVSASQCWWRQTGGCSPTGTREANNDKPCFERVAKGASGFCDCDGDGQKGNNEPGYTCKTTPHLAHLSSCVVACNTASMNGFIADVAITNTSMAARTFTKKRENLDVCKDIDNGATDKDGYNCSAYDGPGNNSEYDDDDFSADAMCCNTGGGKHEASIPVGTTHVLAFSKNHFGESDHCASASFVDEFSAIEAVTE